MSRTDKLFCSQVETPCLLVSEIEELLEQVLALEVLVCLGVVEIALDSEGFPELMLDVLR